MAAGLLKRRPSKARPTHARPAIHLRADWRNESGLTERADARFDGRTRVVRIPITFRRRGGRKLILAPDGADGLDAEPPRPDGTALRALGRAWRWHRLLEAGRHPSIKALARAEAVHHAYVAKLLRLTLLAPDIVEAVLDGRLPKGVRLEDLVRPLPAGWAGQRRVLLKGGGG
jgi:hypothetical protein